MADPKLDDVKKGVAALVATLVKTMDDTAPGASAKFIERLDQVAYDLKGRGASAETLETIGWARESITGFGVVSGQGSPLITD